MSTKRTAAWPLALALAGGASGCFFMPKEAGVRLQTDVAVLRTELARLQAAQQQLSAARLEHDQVSDAQLARVQKRLDESSKNAHVAEADMGTQLDRLLEDVARLRGSLEDNEHRLTESESKIEQRLNERIEALKKAADQHEREASARAKKAVPKGKKEQLAYARKALAEGRGEEGRPLLRELATRYAKERGVGDEALFALAKDAQGAGNAELALRDFVRLLDLFPSGSHADEATFRVGQCAQATGRGDDARTFYTEVSNAFPRSPWAGRAKAQLAALGRAGPAGPRPAGGSTTPAATPQQTLPPAAAGAANGNAVPPRP